MPVKLTEQTALLVNYKQLGPYFKMEAESNLMIPIASTVTVRVALLLMVALSETVGLFSTSQSL